MRRSRIHRPSLDEIAEIGRSRYADPERWPDRPGNLPPLAGGGRLVRTQVLVPYSEGAKTAWSVAEGTKVNAVANKYEEASAKTKEEWARGEGTPAEKPFVHGATASKGQSFLYGVSGSPWTLPAGAKVKKVISWFYFFTTGESQVKDEWPQLVNKKSTGDALSVLGWGSNQAFFFSSGATELTKTWEQLTVRLEKGETIEFSFECKENKETKVSTAIIAVEYEEPWAPHVYLQAVQRAASW